MARSNCSSWERCEEELARATASNRGIEAGDICWERVGAASANGEATDGTEPLLLPEDEEEEEEEEDEEEEEEERLRLQPVEQGASSNSAKSLSSTPERRADPRL